MITPDNSTTTCGEEVTDNSPPGAPSAIDPTTGQHSCYYVLKPEERAKGFVRPVRTSYTHIARVQDIREPFGRQTEQLMPCGAKTSMSQDIAETYARDPSYYGSTFCIACRDHRSVNEFQWEDGTKVGS